MEHIFLFNEHFLKPGLLPKETGSALRRAFENRQVADYDPDLDVTEEAARKTLEAAADFVETITRMIRP